MKCLLNLRNIEQRQQNSNRKMKRQLYRLDKQSQQQIFSFDYFRESGKLIIFDIQKLTTVKEPLKFLRKSFSFVQQISWHHNSLILTIGFKYLADLFNKKQEEKKKNLLTIYGQIKTGQVSMTIMRVQTIPSKFVDFYDKDILAGVFFNGLHEIQLGIERRQKRNYFVRSEVVRNVLNSVPIFTFALICFVRGKLMRELVNNRNFGNQFEVLTDYEAQLRNHFISLIASSFKTRIQIYYWFQKVHKLQHQVFIGRCIDQRTDVLLRSGLFEIMYRKNMDQEHAKYMKLLVVDGKEFNKFHTPPPYQLHSFDNFLKDEKENCVQLITYRDKRSIKNKNFLNLSGQCRQKSKGKTCLKCGRIKVQKFCICRKSKCLSPMNSNNVECEICGYVSNQKICSRCETRIIKCQICDKLLLQRDSKRCSVCKNNQ